MSDCLIALGSNLGDREANLRDAASRIGQVPNIRVVAESTIRTTPPVGGPPQQSAYLNAVLRAETSLPPDALLEQLLAIESDLGRERATRWSARSIDLDLLLFDQICVATPDLVVPHPRMSHRRFVLEPACEIAPDMVHPQSGWTLQRHLDNINRPHTYLVVCGPSNVPTHEIAIAIAARSSAQYVADPAKAMGSSPFKSAGRSLESTIELLRVRSQALRGVFSVAGATPLLSSFWLNESLAEARFWLTPREWKQLSVWWADQPPIEPPKLVVLLNPRARSRRPIGGRSEEVSEQPAGPPDSGEARSEFDSRFHELLTAEISRAGGLPVLELDSAQPSRVLDETCAAIESMR